MRAKSAPAITLLVLVLGGIAIGSWYASSRGIADATPQKRITIGTFTKSLGNSPFHVAYHFGWFNEHPALKDIKVQYINFNDRPSISDAFGSGELEVLFSADIPQILCRAQGNDIRIVALSASMHQDILVQRDLAVSTMAELKGHSLAVLQGTSSYFGLLKILQDEKLALSDFDIRYMTADEARTAFESHQIDAWAVWAPFVEQQQVSGAGKLIAAGRAPINSCMAVAKELLDRDPATVEAMVEVLERAKAWIAEHPRETERIISKEFDLAPKVIAIALPKFNWHAELDDLVVEDIQWKAKFLAESQQTRTEKVIDVKRELLDRRFAPKSDELKEAPKKAA